MPAKSKKTKTNHTARSSCTRRARCNARRSFKKGGMFRRAVSATGRVVNKVMGEGLDKLDKYKQIADAIEKGVTQTQTPEKFKQVAALSRFSASPSSMSSSMSPLRLVSETHRRKFHDANDDFKTPNKSKPVNEAPPNLGTRVRHRETPEERARRLGFSVAPTINDATSVVGELFP